MIDLDKIEQQCKNAMQNGYGHLPVIECGNAVKVMELITRIRKAEKDAARYRWVRSASIAELNEFCNMIRPHRDGFVDDAIIEDGMQCNK